MNLSETLSKPLLEYLKHHKLLQDSEEVLHYNKAGEGNMNLVMRLRTEHSSLIIKQSRDYVNKYPQIAAPIERIGVEHFFFNEVNKDPFFKPFSPQVLHFDKKEHLLIMDDLGEGTDYMSIYADPQAIEKAVLLELVKYLVKLHEKAPKTFPSNMAMRKLNHEHIFDFPFNSENGFNLNDVQAGLASIAVPYQKDEKLKKIIQATGDRYLSKGTSLLHGDFYPGSWLKVESGLKVIDPEFGFVGDPEFDLGVMLAHFKMAGMAENLIQHCVDAYSKERNVNLELLHRYHGIEIMRRLIGIAQLPLSRTLAEKSALLQEAKALILA